MTLKISTEKNASLLIGLIVRKRLQVFIVCEQLVLSLVQMNDDHVRQVGRLQVRSNATDFFRVRRLNQDLVHAGVVQLETTDHRRHGHGQSGQLTGVGFEELPEAIEQR